MKCSNHPRYKGVRKSTTGCLKCKIIRALRRISSACGVSAPVPATRVQDFIRKGGARFASEQDARVEKPSGDDARPVEHIKSPFVDLLAADLEPPTRDYLFVGGPADGQTITLACDASEHIYTSNSGDDYTCTLYEKRMMGGTPVFGFAERLLAYRTEPCVDSGSPVEPICKHDFGKLLPRYKKFLFVGGPANLQIRKVGESHEYPPRPCELTMPDDLNIYIYRMRVTDWTSNPYPVAYVLDGMSDSELATQLEAYRSLGPLDSGGELC